MAFRLPVGAVSWACGPLGLGLIWAAWFVADRLFDSTVAVLLAAVGGGILVAGYVHRHTRVVKTEIEGDE